MPLAAHPPIEPMLAKLARELPTGPGWTYEPKWDGFRCLVFRDGDDVDLRSRNDRPLARYFPEVVAALLRVRERAFALDGELLVERHGRLNFDATLSRLHPARSRVERLAVETPASFVAFDVLATGEHDLQACSFSSRRARLSVLLAAAPDRIRLTPTTADPCAAEAWLDHRAPGIDGVVAKRADAQYQPGRRTMVKVKREHTVDCVVAGTRLLAARPVVSSLLLGLYENCVLHHVGVVASLRAEERESLIGVLAPYVTSLEGHPWEHGFGSGGSLGRLKGTAGRWTPDLAQDWVPLRPELVCEVGYDQLDGLRFRHPARLRRWRPDRDPRSCTIDQLLVPA